MEGTNNLTQMLDALRHKAEHENIGIIIVGGTPKEAHFLGAASRNDLLFVSTSSKSPKLNKVMQRLYDCKYSLKSGPGLSFKNGPPRGA